MPTAIPARPGARERILDAAFTVMTTQGLARATTKEIAKTAGYSEANLYKHFRSKEQLFVAVLTERLPSVREVLGSLTPGEGAVRDNIHAVALAAIPFYRSSVPITGALFADPTLLAHHRASLPTGAGPYKPLEAFAAYLQAEQLLGRLTEEADPAAMAMLLFGACMQQGFFTAYDGTPPLNAEQAAQLAERLTRVIAAGTVVKET